ncbi:putative porin [uncultured Bacteroides sp.]|uniref:putative porin n=1 Tax=uncultured Bacteroides sp. TaxID=162156 RepID=UPI002AAB8472|nr:putative porin [uncultured Bacteroides sp.]
MKRFIILYYIILAIAPVGAIAQVRINDAFDENGNQIDPSMRIKKDTSNVEVQSIPPKLYMWNISQELGNINPIETDTIYQYFQNTNLTEGIKGHYNYLGNLGAPRLSRLFFERTEASSSMFMDPFSSFYQNPWKFKFTNSNVPYTNISYYKGGSKIDGEERFKSYFSVNVNKRLAFGFNIDYLYGRGRYNDQSTAFFTGGLFGSYIGERYQAHFIYNNYTMKMAENGGITDDRYITNPEAMAEGKKEYEAANIPTKLESTWNKNNKYYVYFTHRYNLGFTRKASGIENDTLDKYIPVTSFIHTVNLEKSRHRFLSKAERKGFYDNTYINTGGLASNDSTTYISLKNTFGISLLEGFNKYAKSGLTAYISHKMSKYELMNKDSVSTDKYNEQEVYLGGELSKRQGNVLHYIINGEVGMLEKAIGQFRVKGNINLDFHLWKDTVNLVARASISKTLPAFYMRHYHSNHFYWDNTNFSNEFRSHIEGELNIQRWHSNLKVGVENIKDYTYFNQNALPAQFSDNIQVISAIFNQNFKLGIFHLDNEITWQQTSNATILPLPKISLYHNLYLETKLAKKVLSVQLGADVRYFSKYHAPAYTPAIQHFNLQANDDQIEIGGYPIVNLYANLQLKRTRFFIMMYHANQGMMSNSNYFLAPHYPINPKMLKFGLSWNFYD